MGTLLRRLRWTPVAVAAIALVTAVCSVLPASGTTAALLLLLVILFLAAYGGLLDAVLASIAATLCLDYFFLPPIGKITIASPEDLIALLVFLTVALFASRLSNKLRSQRDEVLAGQRETERQYALGRSLLLSESPEDIRRTIVSKCIELFGVSEAALFESESELLSRSHSDGIIAEQKLRQSALCGTVEHEPLNDVTIIPVSLGNHMLGSLGVRGRSLPESSLQAIGNTVAIGLAQAQAQQASSRAEAVRKGEELKSVLLDALAHDLKTPLTAMEAAAGMLRQPALVSADQGRDLLDVIYEEVQGLKRMLDQAIHLARIDAERLKLNLRPLSADELIRSAIAPLGEGNRLQEIRVDISPDLPCVAADAELLTQALKQLIDNAVKYSPPSATVTISAWETDGRLSIGVQDQGQGLIELEQSRVFDKFYRGRYNHSSIQGTGMGLAIAREIVEAHGGTITVQSHVGEGSLFTITLQAVSTAQPIPI